MEECEGVHADYDAFKSSQLLQVQLWSKFAQAINDDGAALENIDNTIYMRVMLRMNLMFSMMGESDGNENNCDFHHNGNVDGY